MRIPSSVFVVGRYALVLGVIGVSAVLMSADKRASFSRHDKAFYADPSVIEYVQPGLVFSVVSAKVAADGTISVDYKVSDPTGAPLDVTGVLTPGTVRVSYLAAYIGAGQTQFTSYFTTVATAATGGATATQASGDSGGTVQTVATGEYVYTFKGKAINADLTRTHRIGVYGSRNLTTWSLGTNYADTTYDFVPNGAKVTVVRDVVRTPDCNSCHDSLAEHGGSRRSVQLCIMCHQPQTTDPNTGNSLDMPVLIHKIHMGSSLPSVVAGGKYQIIGYQNSVNDWSTVVFPADARRCQVCHNPKNGAAQTSNYETSPNRAACGACHDDINFASGKNHVNLPQANDSQCTQCHQPKDGGEFDASIEGAHVIPENSVQVTGMNFALLKVTNGAAGQKPTVTFTVTDNNKNAIPMTTMATGSLSLTMSGPTTDYGNTNFGSDVSTPGYVTESVASTAKCAGDGTCTYTFTHAVPAGAKGTFVIGIEGRLTATLQAGTVVQQSVQYAGVNQVIYFSVDGSPVTPRRTVVALTNCNNCHAKLELHGGLRNNTEYCVICHNPNNTDASTRPTDTVVANRSLPNQAINFALMVHKIHTGVNLAQFNQTYVVVGHGGAESNFSGVRFPAMSPTGAVHDTTDCAMCHVNASEAVLPIGKIPVLDPQGMLSPSPTTTSACTACHLNLSAFAHAVTNTNAKFGEACQTCHGTGADFDVSKVHAGM